MARVYDKNGKLLAEVKDDLLRDFFDEVFVEEKPLLHTLIDYTPASRNEISNYIVHRLAQALPGYLPNPIPYDYETEGLGGT